jgi:hypothetical protein
MTFTVNCTGPHTYQLALYFVDWDNRGRRLAVEMFDANTLDLIAPVKAATNFYGGKYLVYTCNKSVKFRIDHVRGDNAVLSGIFFDPPPANTAPVLGAISDKYVYAGQTVRFTATATDAQSAYQTLTFSLSNAPAGASINPSSGVFSWVTTNAVAPGTNLITVQVMDNGTPPLSASRTFSVFVSASPQLTGAVAGNNGQIQITFNTLPGQNYQVQFKDNLADSSWTSLGGIIAGAGSVQTVSGESPAVYGTSFQIQLCLATRPRFRPARPRLRPRPRFPACLFGPLFYFSFLFEISALWVSSSSLSPWCNTGFWPCCGVWA